MFGHHHTPTDLQRTLARAMLENHCAPKRMRYLRESALGAAGWKRDVREEIDNGNAKVVRRWGRDYVEPTSKGRKLYLRWAQGQF